MKRTTALLIEESPHFQSALTSILRDLGFSVVLHSSVQAKVAKQPQVILIDVASLGENPQELQTLLAGAHSESLKESLFSWRLDANNHARALLNRPKISWMANLGFVADLSRDGSPAKMGNVKTLLRN